MTTAREGRKFINVDEMISKAITEEEKQAWEERREQLSKIDFVADWYVDIYKHACGHWEILQSPVYAGQTPQITKSRMVEESSKRKCTRCVCNW